MLPINFTGYNDFSYISYAVFTGLGFKPRTLLAFAENQSPIEICKQDIRFDVRKGRDICSYFLFNWTYRLCSRKSGTQRTPNRRNISLGAALVICPRIFIFRNCLNSRNLLSTLSAICRVRNSFPTSRNYKKTAS